MLFSRQKMVWRVLLAAIAVFVLVAQIGAPNEGQGAFKLEGAWVARVPGTPLQWSYVLSPDPSGRSASIHGSIEVGFGGGVFYPPFAAVEFVSPIIGEVVTTDQDTVTFNSLWYGLKKTTPTPTYPFSAEVVYIGMNSGEIKFVGPGKGIGTHNLVFYLPSQDSDGDGFPDPGQQPVLVLPTTTTAETRLPPPR